jgi:hypothetical protein
MGKKLRACKTCGKKTGGIGHLCDPTELTEAFVCVDCGASSLDAKHICKPKLGKLKYTCKKCGRVSVESDKLCKPKKINYFGGRVQKHR